ncbi:transporter substrate-binding domain-containing protein [Aliiglaciecola sp. CAU 1673]|uniref:transporter substrate-binding domain-containing protein n=1 Tax=Aliiglaciecola sp. CAU 1673 TaxID=3032595 RepID=UPI0023DB61E5|nr:transporter substrate-binding domain-containing protein [Aliiglaciecola sp. CAU 1673]MDF2178152.1 transporter substrate-binding domain-containing protein [Aliiglaciecola sp. CAU 1673]
MRRIYLFVLSIVSSAAAQDHIPDTMLWLTTDAPVHRQANPMDVSGATLSLLLKQMPQIRVKHISANTNRIFSMLEQETSACAGNFLKTSLREEAFPSTTHPQTIFLGLRLYVRADNALDLAQPVVLEEFLASMPNKQFGVVGGRSYGDKFDAIFSDAQWNEKLWIRNAEDMAAGLVDMLIQGRVSAILEYPSVVAHYKNQFSSDVPLLSYSLHQSPLFSLGYIYCSPTPQGRALVAAFDKAIEAASRQESYLQAHLRWFPEAQHNELQEIFTLVYGTEKQP